MYNKIFSEFINKYSGNNEGDYVMIKCPSHEDNKPSCKISLGDNGKLLVHCFAGCSQETLINKFREDGMWIHTYNGTNCNSKKTQKKPLTAKTIESSIPIENPAAELARRYLEGRGLDSNNAPGILFSTNTYCEEIKDNKPSVVFVFKNEFSETQALQRVFIDNDGSKAKLNSPKKYTASVKGYFASFGEQTKIVALTEGCETALAIYQSTGFQTFASGGCSNMKNFVPPTGIELVVIAADKDNGMQGQKAAYTTQHALISKGVNAIVVVPKQDIPEEKNNIDFLDVLKYFGKENVKKQIEKVISVGALESKLIKTKDGNLRNCMGNAILIISYHDDWRNKLGFDAFENRITWLKEPSWNDIEKPSELIASKHWTDEDISRTSAWFIRKYGFEPCNKTISNAVAVVAQKNAFHSVQEYLQSLKWEGVERLNNLPALYFGTSSTEYSVAVCKKFLISAVARIIKPGCKADCALILEGRQGAKKSSGMAALFGEYWFNDTLTDLGSKDFYISLNGVWCVELAELAAIRKGDINRIKAVLSARSDNYRSPYGYNTKEYLRQCVFVGTVNDDTYLTDDTGNRRFWPISVGEIDIDAIRRDRDQIWAEALYLYLSNEKWWFSSEEERRLCTPEQDSRTQTDPWEEIISNYFCDTLDKTKTTMTEILGKCLHITPDKIDKHAQTRVGKILKKLAWKKSRTSQDGGRGYVYEKIK